MRTFSEWSDLRPGFFEADLVAHCGGYTDGAFRYTLCLTDVATGWTECLPCCDSLRTNYLFTDHGRRIAASRVDTQHQLQQAVVNLIQSLRRECYSR